MNGWHLKLKILNFFPSSFQCDSVLSIGLNGFCTRIMQVKECKSFTYNFQWTKENKRTHEMFVSFRFCWNFRSVPIQNSRTHTFFYDVTAYYINIFHGNRWEYWAKYLEGKWVDYNGFCTCFDYRNRTPLQIGMSIASNLMRKLLSVVDRHNININVI